MHFVLPHEKFAAILLSGNIVVNKSDLFAQELNEDLHMMTSIANITSASFDDMSSVMSTIDTCFFAVHAVVANSSVVVVGDVNCIAEFFSTGSRSMCFSPQHVYPTLSHLVFQQRRCYCKVCIWQNRHQCHIF